MQVNFDLVQGDSIDRTITITNTSDKSLFDLTGYSCRGQMRKDPQSVTAIDFAMTISQDKKSIAWHLDPTVSATITPGVYVYQIEIISTTVTITIVMGKITVLPEVSK